LLKDDKHVTDSHLLVAKDIRNVIETFIDFCLQGLARGNIIEFIEET
jgi:hypothetical protein